MAYTKQTWATGDVVTADKMNHIENGIAATATSIALTVSAETLQPNESATATVTGGGNDPFNIEFGIPKGATGSQGPAGNDGAQGPAGNDGADGDDGITPAVAVTSISGGHNVAFNYGTGDSRNTNFNVMDGAPYVPTGSEVANAIDDWMDANITQETGYVLDRSLSSSTAAAPADLVGSAIVGASYSYNQSISSGWSGGQGEYWNITSPLSIPKGFTCKFTVTSFSGTIDGINFRLTKGSSDYENFYHIGAMSNMVDLPNSIVGVTPTDDEYSYVWIQVKRLSTLPAVTISYTIEFGDNIAVEEAAKISKIAGKSIEVTETLSANASGVSESWNFYIPNPLIEGNLLAVTLKEYTGSQYLQTNVYTTYTRNNLDNLTLVGSFDDIGKQHVFEVDPVSKTLRFVVIQIRRTGSEKGVSATVRVESRQKIAVDGAESSNSGSTNKYFTCLKSGGDYNKLSTAVQAVCEYKNAVLYVGPGVWDLIDELGSTYINSINSNNRGLYLKNGVHIICSSDAVIKCNYTGSNSTVIQWLSAFNAGTGGFTLENATIETSKCRYTIHDERDYNTDHYENRYINCRMKHDSTNGGMAQCIGGGLGYDGYIVIKGCVFESVNVNNTGIVSYHNTWYGYGNTASTGRSTIEFSGNYVKGTNTFRGSWFGASHDITTFIVSGNSLGAAPIHTVESQSEMDSHSSWIQNTEMFAWNNEVRT